MNEDVLVSEQDGVLEIRLNRPAKKNALTNAMYGAMADAIVAGEKNGAVRAILFSARGDMFTAGNDIADFAAAGSSESADTVREVGRFLRVLVLAEKPVIAAVSGDGVGIGTTMLLHCDVVIIAEDAKLMTPFTALGVTPEAGSSLLLPRLLGHAQAYKMLALGLPLSGGEAARLGLASEAVAREEVEACARKAAQACCSRPPEAMRITKALMRDRDAILARIEKENALFQERLRSPEAKAAFEAFLKR